MGQEVVDHCFSDQDWYAIAVRVDVLSGGMTGGGKAFCHGKKYYTEVGSVLADCCGKKDDLLRVQHLVLGLVHHRGRCLQLSLSPSSKALKLIHLCDVCGKTCLETEPCLMILGPGTQENSSHC